MARHSAEIAGQAAQRELAVDAGAAAHDGPARFAQLQRRAAFAIGLMADPELAPVIARIEIGQARIAVVDDLRDIVRRRIGAGLDEQHLASRRRKPVGQDAARGAPADDDVVIAHGAPRLPPPSEFAGTGARRSQAPAMSRGRACLMIRSLAVLSKRSTSTM